MKSFDDVKNLLIKFNNEYGVNAINATQGDQEWFNLKLGVLSASNAKSIVAGTTTDARKTYMANLIAQICTGIMPEIKSYHLEWGKHYESAARASYEFQTGRKLTQLPFVFKDDTFRCGVSPDSFSNDGRDVEIKCSSNSENHLKFIMCDTPKSEWLWQINYNMWCRESELIDFCSYDPRMNVKSLAIKTFERDKEKFKKFDDTVPKFIEDMDKHLDDIGIKFGDHWLKLKESFSEHIK